MGEEAHPLAAALPAVEVLEKLAHLERLQRMRQGESPPAPLTVEVSESG